MGSNASYVGAEVVAVLEVELVLSRTFDGHREREPRVERGARDCGAVLLVDEHSRADTRCAVFDRAHECLVDEVLRVDDAGVHRGRDRRSGSEEALLEGPAMVEGHEVERLVVAERHHGLLTRQDASGRERSAA